MNQYWIIAAIALPILGAAAIPLFPFRSRSGMLWYIEAVVLLTSALLTAGYLLPITVNGFLPGADYDYSALKKKEPNMTMLLPLLILAVLAVALGLFPNPLTAYISRIVAGVL